MIALESNQIRALNYFINYIVTFQNEFAFNFLFKECMIDLIEKGIRITKLLQSDLFEHTFEFEDWPGIHTNDGIEY